jgi:CheY-like chemotaxis protein
MSDRGRVLIVDDDEPLARTLQRMLKSHEVRAVSSVKEALALVESGERFDAILCALSLPTTTGMEMYATLMKTAPDQARAMIFLTAGTRTAQARAFLAEIPNRSLGKPFEISELRSMINAQLGRPAPTSDSDR